MANRMSYLNRRIESVWNTKDVQWAKKNQFVSHKKKEEGTRLCGIPRVFGSYFVRSVVDGSATV